IALLAAMLVIMGIVAVGSRIWPSSPGTLQAAPVRFEVRLAETVATPGLQEVRVSGSREIVYLHPDVVISNDDVARSRLVQGSGPSRFGVAVDLTGAGAQKIR